MVSRNDELLVYSSQNNRMLVCPTRLFVANSPRGMGVLKGIEDEDFENNSIPINLSPRSKQWFSRSENGSLDGRLFLVRCKSVDPLDELLEIQKSEIFLLLGGEQFKLHKNRNSVEISGDNIGLPKRLLDVKYPGDKVFEGASCDYIGTVTLNACYLDKRNTSALYLR